MHEPESLTTNPSEGRSEAPSTQHRTQAPGVLIQELQRAVKTFQTSLDVLSAKIVEENSKLLPVKLYFARAYQLHVYNTVSFAGINKPSSQDKIVLAGALGVIVREGEADLAGSGGDCESRSRLNMPWLMY